jgi:aminoglycoside 6'-N-acetyltransferase I
LASRYGLQIRAASGADAPGIAELMEAAGHPVDVATIGTRLEAFRQEAGVALLALEWGPPSGLIVLNWYRTLSADLAVAQISTLLVAPDDRRRGRRPGRPQRRLRYTACVGCASRAEPGGLLHRRRVQ